MSVTGQDTFRRWHLPWKERVCEEARPFSHGTAFRSPATHGEVAERAGT
jgi:hypothetical protein